LFGQRTKKPKGGCVVLSVPRGFTVLDRSSNDSARNCKKPNAGPCRTLSAEQRAEVERQMREQGRLLPISEVELEKLRNTRRLRATREVHAK
jgi:hypothetical protein